MPSSPRSKKKLGYTKREPPYKISHLSIALMAVKPKEISPYLMHAERLAILFRKGNLNLPLNLFWYSMAFAAGDEAQREQLKAKRYTTSFELYNLLQNKRAGKEDMMVAFQRMTEQTFKWVNPGAWELENGEDTGLMDYVAGALVHLDYVLTEVHSFQEGIPVEQYFNEQRPRVPPETFTKAGLAGYARDFQKAFAHIVGETIPEGAWKDAVSWGNPYSPGMLTTKIQKGSAFLKALESLSDDDGGRRAAFGMLERAAAVIKATPQCKAVGYWPQFQLQDTRFGESRKSDGSHVSDYRIQLWRYGEDHMPVNGKEIKTGGFSFCVGVPQRFQAFLKNLGNFATYAISLGHGSGDYRGITTDPIKRAWAQDVARNLIFFVEELGLLNEERTWARDPFFLLNVNEQTGRVGLAFDVDAFAARYSRLHEIAAQVDEEGIMAFSGEMDWAFRTQAETLFSKFGLWAKQLKRVRARDATSAEYWAEEAALLQGRVAVGDKRPREQARLPVLPRGAELSGVKRAKREVLPPPDAQMVVVGNDPQPEKRRRAVQPPVPPANVHAERPMAHVAAPASRNVPVPGMPPAGAGRDGAAEEKTAQSGNMQGTERLLDLIQETPADGEIVGAPVVAATRTGKHPRSRGNTSPEPKRPKLEPATPMVEPMSLELSGASVRFNPTIANHPLAMMGGPASSDVSVMVTRVVAEEGFDLDGAVKSEIVRVISGIAQPQQWAQQFKHTSQPRKSGGWIEASGFFFPSDTSRGPTYGLVRGVNAEGPPKKLLVSMGGTDRTVDQWDGVYRPHGPHPILQLSTTAGPHLRLPRLDRARLKNQKAALTADQVRNVVRNEIMFRDAETATDGFYREGVPAFARQLAARYKAIPWNSPLETTWNDYAFQDFFGATFNRTGKQPRLDLVRRVREEYEKIRSGSSQPVYSPDPTWAGNTQATPVPQPAAAASADPVGPDPVSGNENRGNVVPPTTDAALGEHPNAVSDVVRGLDSTAWSVIITVAIVVALLAYEL